MSIAKLATLIKALGGGGGGGSSGGGNLVVHRNNGTLDKTWKEIYDALGAGYYTIILNEADEELEHVQITNANKSDGYYYIGAGVAMLQSWYKTDTENGYPVLDQ